MRSAQQRRRLVAGGAIALVVAGGGWALASGSGPDPAPSAPNGGSAVSGANPQREVAVQPSLAAQQRPAKTPKPAAP